MKKLIKKFTVEHHFEDVINRTVLDLLDSVIGKFSAIIDTDLKSRILSDIINATYDVIKNNSIPLLQAIDFHEVTVNEISVMEPKQIEKLFNSIGSKYFRKLEIYGVFGGIFAVEEVTLLSFLLYVSKLFKRKEPKEVNNDQV